MENKTKAQELAYQMSNFVNSFSSDHQEFISEMNKDHRTLQQSFTKLCLKWIEHCASDDYRHDLRNQDSHTTCKKMVRAFQKENDNFLPSNLISVPEY